MDQQLLANEFAGQLREELGNQRLLGPDDLRKLALVTGKVIDEKVGQLRDQLLRVVRGLQKVTANQRDSTGNLDALVSAINAQTEMMSKLLLTLNAQQGQGKQPTQPPSRRYEIVHNDGSITSVRAVQDEVKKDDDILPHPGPLPLNLPHPCP